MNETLWGMWTQSMIYFSRSLSPQNVNKCLTKRGQSQLEMLEKLEKTPF